MGGRRGGDDLSLLFHRIHPFRRPPRAPQSRRVIPFPLSTFAFGTMYDQFVHRAALGTSSASHLLNLPNVLKDPKIVSCYIKRADIALFVGRCVMSTWRDVVCRSVGRSHTYRADSRAPSVKTSGRKWRGSDDKSGGGGDDDVVFFGSPSREIIPPHRFVQLSSFFRDKEGCYSVVSRLSRQ